MVSEGRIYEEIKINKRKLVVLELIQMGHSKIECIKENIELYRRMGSRPLINSRVKDLEPKKKVIEWLWDRYNKY